MFYFCFDVFFPKKVNLLPLIEAILDLMIALQATDGSFPPIAKASRSAD